MVEAWSRRRPTHPGVFVRLALRPESPWFWQGCGHPRRLTGQTARARTAAFPIPHLSYRDLNRRTLLGAGDQGPEVTAFFCQKNFMDWTM
jgi:hypothetical protein